MGLQSEYLNILIEFLGHLAYLFFFFSPSTVVRERHHPRIHINARKTQTHLLLAHSPSHQRNPSFLPCKCCGDCFTQDWKAARLHSMIATPQFTAMLYTTKNQEWIAGFKSDTHLQQTLGKHLISGFRPYLL